MINANRRYDTNLRIASYRAITDLLAKRRLTTKEEDRKIRKCIERMQDDLIRADEACAHDRDLSTM